MRALLEQPKFKKKEKDYAEAINFKTRGIDRVKIDWAKLRLSQSHGITNEFLPNNFFPKFTGSATGNELVLLADVNGEKVELLRTPLNCEPDLTALGERLRLFYLEGVRKLIGA